MNTKSNTLIIYRISKVPHKNDTKKMLMRLYLILIGLIISEVGTSQNPLVTGNSFECGENVYSTDSCSFYFECDCCKSILHFENESEIYSFNFCLETTSVCKGNYTVTDSIINIQFDGITAYQYDFEGETTFSDSIFNPYSLQLKINSCGDKIGLVNDTISYSCFELSQESGTVIRQEILDEKGKMKSVRNYIRELENKPGKTHPITGINLPKTDTLTGISEPFIVNNIKCYWKLTIIFYDDFTGGTGTMELKNHNTHKTLLSDEDYYDRPTFDFIDFSVHINENFKDANFDGFKDYVVYSRQGSGSGGDLYNVYLFNNKKKSYELSEILSGGHLEIDTINKTVSGYWKMGVPWNQERVHYFGEKGKIKYTEVTTREVILSDTTRLLQITYEKIIDDKVIEMKIDTTIFEGY